MLWKKNPLLMCQSGSPINVWSPLLLPLNYACVISKKKFPLPFLLPKIPPRVLSAKIPLFLFLHQFSAVEDSSLINGPSPNFQHVSLCIFSHEKASIHSHNSLVSTTKFRLQEFTFCMILPSKELSICNHIFCDSSMEIYKFKAIISIKLL